MSIVTDFKSINRKFNRMEQKAEFEEKNPVETPAMYGWPYQVMAPLSSQAHPDWPYAGTPHEWRGFKRA